MMLARLREKYIVIWIPACAGMTWLSYGQSGVNSVQRQIDPAQVVFRQPAHRRLQA
ncbi:hypothetical protein Slit_2912 [Sideroxydans lithotrophicus ES-1]|uniref:Uncharacterized protein n=1 Tax=Sideroxydans lithotrophicus (strain ES-1) TaxID=580332 RepID=D5CQB6_SIDLE|nr:hypothetical protein Slit_2912 [Sideroxydans lithotrophicus ES-1]